MRLAVLGSALLALGTPGAAQRTTVLDAVSERHVDRTTRTEDVRFRNDSHDRMTVPVRLNGRGPYRFLVDTGADRSAISRQLASSLKLTSGPTATLHSISGAAAVQTANVPSIELTHKVVHDVDAAMLDSGHMGADGILGVDSLRSQRVVFDFKAKTMAIVPSVQQTAKSEAGTIVVRGRLRNGRLLLTNATADDQLISVVIDTGSEVTIGNQALRRKLAGKGSLRRSGPVILQSVTGQAVPGEYMFINKLSLGGVTLENLAIVFADAHTFNQLALNERPALLLGMNAMRAFDRVSIDFANKKLRVLLPEHSALQNTAWAAR